MLRHLSSFAQNIISQPPLLRSWKRDWSDHITLFQSSMVHFEHSLTYICFFTSTINAEKWFYHYSTRSAIQLVYQLLIYLESDLFNDAKKQHLVHSHKKHYLLMQMSLSVRYILFFLVNGFSISDCFQIAIMSFLISLNDCSSR